MDMKDFDEKDIPLEHGSEELIHHEGNKNAGQPTSADLLNNFLEQISGQIAVQSKPVISEIQDIHSIDRSQYSEMEMTSGLEQKISDLQIIANSIEKKNINPDIYSNLDLSKFKVNYRFDLNSTQQTAVFTTEKPVLVIAGAGSGKTRIIVYRVSYLIEKGVDAQSILLLTFTRKASKEMLDRVETLLQDKRTGNVTGGTFHSFAAFVLRKYANMLNLPANFTIIDTSDSEDIIDLIRTELKLNTKDKKFPRKSRIHDIISYSRNKNTTVSAIIHEQYSGLIDFIADIELIHSGYSKYKALSRIFDYDDLIEVL